MIELACAYFLNLMKDPVYPNKILQTSLRDLRRCLLVIGGLIKPPDRKLHRGCRLGRCISHLQTYLDQVDAEGEQKQRMEAEVLKNLAEHWCYALEANRYFLIHKSLSPDQLRQFAYCFIEGFVPFSDKDHGDTRATNFSFQLHIAAGFRRAGCKNLCVECDGVDVSCELGQVKIIVECKRPQRMKQLKELAKKANKQLSTRGNGNTLRIIAIDCSKVIFDKISPKLMGGELSVTGIIDLCKQHLNVIYNQCFKFNIINPQIGYILDALYPVAQHGEGFTFSYFPYMRYPSDKFAVMKSISDGWEPDFTAGKELDECRTPKFHEVFMVKSRD